MCRSSRINSLLKSLTFPVAIAASVSSGEGTYKNQPVPSGPVIELLSPSHVMVTIPMGIVTVYGKNFSSNATALLDDNPVNTRVIDSGTIEIFVDVSLNYTPGVHQIRVRNDDGISNSLPWTVYWPEQGPQPFLAIPGYHVGAEADPRTIIAADVNGDRRDDVVIQGRYSSEIAILQGQKDGTLAQPRYITTAAPWALAAGDVNGDANVDLVRFVFAYPSTEYTVLLNDGRGNFITGSSGQVTGIFPGSAGLVDANADGKLDLLVAVTEPTAIYFMANQGNGNFGPPQNLASISVNEREFAVADLNSDGLPDIIYNSTNTETSADEIHVLLNLGGLSFSDSVPASLAGVAGRITAGDFDHDGRQDLAIQSTSPFLPPALRTFLGNGDGTFLPGSVTTIDPTGSAVPYKLVTGDFDHDRHLDLAGVSGASHILYLWGDGTGAFTPQQVYGPVGFHAAVGDINGDGLPDLLVPDRFDEVSVALGRKDRDYPSPTRLSDTFGKLSVADINGDGSLDLFSSGSRDSSAGTVYLNLGNGAFDLAARTPDTTLTSADLNGDDLADYIGSDGHNILIWPGTGLADSPGAVMTIPTPEGTLVFDVRVSDLDKDGHPDLIASQSLFTDNVVLYGRGNFQFDAVTVPFWGTFVIGDFNNDGIPDIVSSSGILLGTGNRGFVRGSGGLPMSFDSILATGEFNGDGIADVAVSFDTLVLVAYGRGDGTFYMQGALTGGQRVSGMVVVDINSDGRSDIVTGLISSAHLVLFTNDRRGAFERSYFASGGSPRQLIQATFHKDRKPGIALLDYGGNTLLFSAMRVAPAARTAFTPPDGATGESLAQVLRWSASAGGTSWPLPPQAVYAALLRKWWYPPSTRL